MLMFTDAQVEAKETVVMRATCKVCGSRMTQPEQAPSYCGDFFESYCENDKWGLHETELFHGNIKDYNVVQRD